MKRLTDAGHTVVRTREPGGTDLGNELREIVLHRRGDIAPRAEALLYAADRAHHIATKVRPALERGEVVIQDRYLDSSVAYQGAGRVLDGIQVRDLSLWAVEGLLPDVTILLDLDEGVGRARLDQARTRYDRLEAEKNDFHARVRASSSSSDSLAFFNAYCTRSSWWVATRAEPPRPHTLPSCVASSSADWKRFVGSR